MWPCERIRLGTRSIWPKMVVLTTGEHFGPAHLPAVSLLRLWWSMLFCWFKVKIWKVLFGGQQTFSKGTPLVVIYVCQCLLVPCVWIVSVSGQRQIVTNFTTEGFCTLGTRMRGPILGYELTNPRSLGQILSETASTETNSDKLREIRRHESLWHFMTTLW